MHKLCSINKILLILFTLCSGTPQLNSVENINAMNLQINSEISVSLSHKYIDFINRIGGGEDNLVNEASFLFAKDCKKNFNGRWVADNREFFVDDLISVYKNHGSWKLIPLNIMTSSENNCIILWINIEAQNFGSNTAIVILRYDSSYLIKEIIEVFSPIQNVYDFNANK